MNRSRFLVLIALAAGLSLAAWWAGQHQQARYEVAQSHKLFPGLEADLARLDQLSVEPAGMAGFTLKLQDGAWGLVERGGYTVDTTVLRRELRKLAAARQVEAKTSNPAYYERLGLQDIDQASSPTVKLSLSAKQQPLLEVLIGKAGKNGHYLRTAGQAQSWLSDTRFNVPGTPANWLAKDIIELPRTRIAAIEVRPAGGPAYRLSRSDAAQTDFTLSEKPAGRDLDFANVNRLGAALARLRLTDVARTATDPSGAWSQSVFRSFDGLVVTVFSQKTDEGGKLRLEARYEAPPMREDSGDESEPVEDAEAVAQRVQAEVAALNARVAGWTYEVASYSASALAFDLEALLKDPPEE